MIRWDRMLETCVRKGAMSMVLTIGSSPMIRRDETWRQLQSPPLTPWDLWRLARQILPSRPPLVDDDGTRYAEFQYGDVARVYVSAYGDPRYHLLLVEVRLIDNIHAARVNLI